MSDPLRTAALREAALAAWERNPDRFREDANSEEDHARGYYRDRVVVELAQNAADAAARAGQPGRLLLRLAPVDGGWLLVAANTGTPLDAAGVASLASLRASAKRDPAAVGRFGVGFAAVRGVADQVSVASAGGVHFSLAGTAAALASATEPLAAEVTSRGSWLPVLRLPFPGVLGEHSGVVEPGWDTSVVLTLRDEAAVVQVRRQLEAVDDGLLLALPALAEITVVTDEVPRRLADVGDRWLVATRSGTVEPALLADRPVEEAGRTGWQVTWAVRRGGATDPGYVHAPTPTQEPCTVPALLIGTFALDPTRRHVAPGPLTDALVTEAGRTWADLLLTCRDGGVVDPLALLPTGLPAGSLDGALRHAVLEHTRKVPLFRPAGGGPYLPATDVLVLAGGGASPTAVALLGRSWPALVDLEPRHRHLVRMLELSQVELTDVVSGLPVREPAQVRDLYDALADSDPATLEELASIPVPLADGRTVHGARGLVLCESEPAALEALSGWGLRVVDPAAAHPLLERLGAQRLDDAGLLAHPVLRERVLAGDVDAGEVSQVVLSLVAAALRSGPLAPEPWLGELLLEAEDGESVPARGLVLPGSDAQRWLDQEVLPAVAGALLERWGAQVLTTVGVRSGLAVLDVTDAPEEVLETLDGWEDYAAAVGAGDGDDALAIADLDAVRSDVWPEVLAGLAAGPSRRALAPARIGARNVPSYATWWLRRRAGIGLDVPFAVTAATGRGVLAVLPPAPAVVAGLDAQAQRWLGGVDTAADLDASAWAEVLGGLEPGTPVGAALAGHAWQALAGFARTDDLGPLAEITVLPARLGDGRLVVTPAEEVAVATTMWAQHPASAPLMVMPASEATAVAQALDLDLAQERAEGRVTSRGEAAATPEAVREVFDVPADWVEHEDLRVDGESVAWWVQGSQVHAATVAGLAHGLAEIVGPRHAGQIERLLVDPGAVGEVLADLAGDHA